MKTLNASAVKVLSALLEKRHLKTDNPAKTIHTKVIYDFGRYRFITLTVLRNDEGFESREPEVTIFHDTLTDEYIPASICNDYAHINSSSASVVYGQLQVMNDKIQADHTEYAHRLLESIAEQYNI